MDTQLIAVTIPARTVVGAALLYAGFRKTRTPGSMERVITRSGYVSHRYAHIPATMVITAELTLGSLLLFGIAPRLTSLLAISLLVLFTLHLAHQLSRGSTEPCGCFGSTKRSLGLSDVFRNVGLMILAGSMFLPGTPPLAITGFPSISYTPLPSFDTLAATTGLVLALAMLWALMIHLIRLVESVL